MTYRKSIRLSETPVQLVFAFAKGERVRSIFNPLIQGTVQEGWAGDQIVYLIATDGGRLMTVPQHHLRTQESVPARSRACPAKIAERAVS
ncbi:MAG TPA: hypothetical protein VGK99_20445 [Acidobacteriota bacterium]|jgi:hypothetical protein